VEYGAFERVGGTRPVEVNVRVIGATNVDLPAWAKDHRFKQDRLSFEVLFLPPLRERTGDILFLAKHFARRMAYEIGMQEIPSFSPGAMTTLKAHTWPGNIRELKNVVERAIYRSTTPYIESINLDPFQSPYPTEKQQPSIPQSTNEEKVRNNMKNYDFERMSLKEAVKNLEIDMIKHALDSTRYHQKKAARLLGLTYDQFRGLLRKHAGAISTR
jgi:psp operon transcriptional activator